MTATIEHLETSGTFSLDGGTWEVDNNVWIVGDEREVIVIDPAHDAEGVAAAVGEREVRAILLTHAHDDHVSEVFDVQRLIGGRVHLNPEDYVLWEKTHGAARPEVEISDGDVFTVAGAQLTAIHTPGHSPGSTCFYAEDLDGAPVLFSGDTLFEGGPGATGKSHSSFETIIESIRTRLFEVLPEATVVHTGHGPKTSIGAEKPHLQQWIDRGE
ncbi:MBL fold metallo-hydrolase [Nesterenkonia aerolata]|uniref:MBL fold metallo-hydrolase n=1 Tax=Nesterenkonia aerolata TaxID=3074079 RepID=A0ABU2DQS6_9MICC|nr:MBL fold metallo-hydrolase [Nesterenkonia sp. LY-0111]MDR8018720.1 MBL fold metallo-hydrolase [Nesterenkonia sp. LY-0111]